MVILYNQKPWLSYSKIGILTQKRLSNTGICKVQISKAGTPDQNAQWVYNSQSTIGTYTAPHPLDSKDKTGLLDFLFLHLVQQICFGEGEGGGEFVCYFNPSFHHISHDISIRMHLSKVMEVHELPTFTNHFLQKGEITEREGYLPSQSADR